VDASPPTTRPESRPILTVFATAVTYLLNPLLLPVVGFVVVAHVQGATPIVTTWVALIGLAFFKVIPLGILAVLIRRGRIDTVEVRAREQRTIPFLLGMASMMAGALAFLLVDLEPARLVSLLAMISVFSAGVLTVITLRWKISVHASAAGALFGLAAFFAYEQTAVVQTSIDMWPVAFLAGVCIPLVGWSRVHLGAHSRGQVLAGTIFGFIMSTGPLYLLLTGGFMTTH
jgi:membrane-associated phospholipid phosphatase